MGMYSKWLDGRIDDAKGAIQLPELGLSSAEIKTLERIYFLACGSAYYAGMVGKYLLEAYAQLVGHWYRRVKTQAGANFQNVTQQKFGDACSEGAHGTVRLFSGYKRRMLVSAQGPWGIIGLDIRGCSIWCIHQAV